ncbi:MAG: DNA repair protein RecO C-terminal domain-containing protein, partial [Anaerolinea sp.]|nr:DNA repair protein RecO C-terminal domain-containing protein [Anaerolinea sp.]
YFELRLLDTVGFRPQLVQCAIEGEPITARDQFFSAQDGGAVCPEHAVRCRSVVPISMTALKLLRHMQRSPYEHVRDLEVASGIHDEVERVLQGYITHVLERRLQTIEFIQQLRR